MNTYYFGDTHGEDTNYYIVHGATPEELCILNKFNLERRKLHMCKSINGVITTFKTYTKSEVKEFLGDLYYEYHTPINKFYDYEKLLHHTELQFEIVSDISPSEYDEPDAHREFFSRLSDDRKSFTYEK